MRPAQRFIKVFVAFLLIVLMSVNMSLACHFMTACCPPPVCCPVVYRCPPPPVCAPVYYAPICSVPAYVDQCGGVVGDVIVDSAVVVESHPAPASIVSEPPMPAAELTTEEALPDQPLVDEATAEPDAEPAEFIEDEPALPFEPDAQPMEAVEPPADLTEDTPELPADDAPADAPAEPALPADDLPSELFEEPAVDPEPADDLFDEPAEPPAADDAVDDLFDAPAVEPDAAEPPAADDAPVDDLFDAPADEPDAAPTEDLFGEADAAPAADDAAEDLFDDVAADRDVAGEEIPAPDDAADDLFDEPDAAEPAGDGGEQPANEIEDLFGRTPAASEGAGPADVQLVTTPEPMDVLRTWTDNTGRFQVRGQLRHILDGKVRILKDNGRYTTVPFHRLSQPDMQFVLDWSSRLNDVAMLR